MTNTTHNRWYSTIAGKPWLLASFCCSLHTFVYSLTTGLFRNIHTPFANTTHNRKSTSGWQIWNILLDFSGGALSIVQLVGDSVAEARAQGLSHGWTTGIAGNPAKLGLGMVSICFDLIFMFQHYVLYRHSSDLSKNPSRSEHDAIRNKEHESPLLAD